LRASTNFFIYLRINRGAAARVLCGAKLTLFVSGVAISALLIASYSQRGMWVASCSTAMSIAALVGWLFIPTVEDPSKVRATLMWLAGQLPLVLDQQTLEDLTTAIAQGSTVPICDAKRRPGCMTAASQTVSPVSHHGDDSQSAGSSSEGRQAMQAGATFSGLEAKTDVKEASGSPVIWLLDEPRASSGAPRFLISGINVSDATLDGVHATLKPDSSRRELELSLTVQGNKSEDNDAIPARARFSLGLEIPTTKKEELLEGAIFAFRYMYAGQQRATIWYLTPTLIARSAKRG
jgi:hypothetical protein